MVAKSKQKENGASNGNGIGNADGPALIISRNKHWRYISCYHGQWLQLPLELLVSMAHDNFYMPRPRLIDPGVFFDIVKIRASVDEAAEEATRANIGTTNPGGSSQQQYDFWGSSGQPPSKMSKERIHRVRQKAARLLFDSYVTDEVACSVIAMQSSSAIDNVGEHVLKRDRDDPTAKYVHFFHEKVPSRSMEQHTSLSPLTEVLHQVPLESQAAILRTRAIVQIFKHDFESAGLDLSAALQIAREVQNRHGPGADQLVLARDYQKEREKWMKDPKSRPRLKDEDQPNSLESQLLFQRAGVYLELACGSIAAALEKDADLHLIVEGTPIGFPQQLRAQQAALLASKTVKTNAKRAYKDYMAFLSLLDYSPTTPFLHASQADDVPNVHPRQLMGLFYPSSADKLANGSTKASGALVPTGREQDRSTLPNGTTRYDATRIYQASALFAEKPLIDLPPPAPQQQPASLSPGACEAVTYHPLLIDTVHSLLLCHCLLQTSPTELNRHAQNVARLARIADGYPLFQVPRSPSRTDWMEVLRRTNNFIKLDTPWTQLSSAPRTTQTKAERLHHDKADLDSDGDFTGRSTATNGKATHGPSKATNAATECDATRKERIKMQAMYEALGDDRVVDPETFAQNVVARQKQAWRDEKSDETLFTATVDVPSSAQQPPFAGGDPTETVRQEAAAAAGDKAAAEKAQQQPMTMNGEKVGRRDVDKEYPVTNARAQLIARWVNEAPLHVAGAGGAKKRRKKKVGAAKRDAARQGVDGGGLAESVDRLTVDGGGRDEEEDDGPD